MLFVCVYEAGTVYILLLNNGTEAIDVWLMDPYTFILIRSPVHGATFEIWSDGIIGHLYREYTRNCHP